MKKIAIDELLTYQQYNPLFDKFLRKVIAEKKLRRVSLNEKMSGLFETRLTVWFQMQEMIRIEQMEKNEDLDLMRTIYNSLLPDDNELSLTLFIEISNQQDLRSFNKMMVGIEKAVELRFGSYCLRSYEPEADDEEEAYTQSIHYLRFPFTEEMKNAFIHELTGPVTVAVTHENFQSETTLSPELVESLQKELAAGQEQAIRNPSI